MRVYARRFNSSGAPQGGEIVVNTYTTDTQARSDVALDSAGNFVVVWQSSGRTATASACSARRFDNSGTKVGAEFQVNQQTTGYAGAPRSRCGRPESSSSSGQPPGRPGRRHHGAAVRRLTGTPVGGEFQVNTRELGTSTSRTRRSSATEAPSSSGRATARMDRAPASTASASTRPAPSSGPSSTSTHTPPVSRGARRRGARGPIGEFAVIWQSAGQDGSDFARPRAAVRPDRQARCGVELPVNNFTTGLQGAPHVAAQPNGQYVAVWDSATTATVEHGIAARLAGVPASRTRIEVDAPVGVVAGSSNLNGVLEAGEARSCAPRSRTTPPIRCPSPARPRISAGLPGPTYTLLDASADYGTIAPAATNDCFAASGDCYQVQITGTRPASALGRVVRRDALVRRASPGPRRCTSEAVSPTCPTATPSIPSSRTSSTTASPAAARAADTAPATTSRGRRWRSSF